MKRNLLCFLSLVFMLTLMAGCNEDDNDIKKFEGEEPADPEMTDALAIAGTYKGYGYVESNHKNPAIGRREGVMKVEVANITERMATITLRNVTLDGGVIKRLAIPDVSVTKDGGRYYASATKQNIDVKYIHTWEEVMEITVSAVVDKDSIFVTAAMKLDDIIAEYRYKGEKYKEHTEAKISGLTFPETLTKWIAGEPEIDTLKHKVSVFVDVETPAGLLKFTPVYTLSEGATLVDAQRPLDFSEDIANGETRKIISDDEKITFTYSFACFKVFNGSGFEFTDWKEESDFRIPAGGWVSNNSTINFLTTGEPKYEGDFTITENPAGAVQIETVDAEGVVYNKKMNRVQAGFLYLGDYNMGTAMFEGRFIDAMEYGFLYPKQPDSLNIAYKYTAGNTCYDKAGNILSDKTDRFRIAGVLFEVNDYTEKLSPAELLTSSKIVAITKSEGGNTSDAGYTKGYIEFEYKKEYVAGKKYKLAVVMTSSVNGDQFEGAPGSKLTIDRLEIVNK